MLRILISATILLASSATAFADELDDGIERYNRAAYGEAEGFLRKAVESKPEDARANRYLGLALLEQEKLEEAERYLRKANEIDPSGDTKGGLARYFAEKKDFGQAEALLESAGGPDAAYARGMVAFNKKSYEDAARELESFLESHPKHAYAHYFAGMAYNGLRRPDKMINHLQMFIKLKPDAREAKAVRAILKTGQ
jgi:tetratricopeptide (TPR) repeat protein